MVRWLLIASMAVVVAAQGLHAQNTGHNSGSIVGTWHLVSLEQPEADGKVHPVDCTGLLVLTADGHMAVQVMQNHPKPSTSQYSQNGYEATFGSVRVDAASHTFVLHVEGALVSSLRGKDLPRAFELHGNQLTIKSTDPAEHWRVVWQRY
jgi:hypothetical protein